MSFDPQLVEAEIALDLISTTDMPKMAWNALEAGFDGPGIRRLAALNFPTKFQVREALPGAMKEMGLTRLSVRDAAVRWARHRAQEILKSREDPLKHTRDFERVWIAAEYSRELSDLGALDDEVHVARSMGRTEEEIRKWLTQKLKDLAGT